MKILCDVHIAYKLVNFLISKGIEATHVNHILDSWFTKDSKIAEFVDSNDYTLVSKDADFKESHLLRSTPQKLIKVNLGNISNKELIKIFEENLSTFQNYMDSGKCMIEINKDSIVIIKEE
ncbi:MAG: DUF5615 family PIN-like protein [Thermoflexibacter sp.]|jgi:predicted nuclease of predicted toxin-antitoxin system|nr:DUF5615 family PIN-like protein [Thermoflexibacter sp.]